MVLLDLNMPLMSGQEVMKEIADDPELCHMPVIILTTSEDTADILKMYKLRCSSYIVKPVDFEQFAKVVSQVTDYWFDLVVLPKVAGRATALPETSP
jgi:two-component system response regulator